MTFVFPDDDTLRLAITSGAIPSSVSLAPVRAGRSAAGALWTAPATTIPDGVPDSLRRIGVTIADALPAGGDDRAHWLQLLPLMRDSSRRSRRNKRLFCSRSAPRRSRSSPVKCCAWATTARASECCGGSRGSRRAIQRFVRRRLSCCEFSVRRTSQCCRRSTVRGRRPRWLFWSERPVSGSNTAGRIH